MGKEKKGVTLLSEKFGYERENEGLYRQ